MRSGKLALFAHDADEVGERGRGGGHKFSSFEWRIGRMEHHHAVGGGVEPRGHCQPFALRRVAPSRSIMDE